MMETPSQVLDRVKSNIVSLLAEHGRKFETSKFGDVYKHRYGEKFPPENLKVKGSRKIAKLLRRNFCDIVQVDNNGTTISLLST